MPGRTNRADEGARISSRVMQSVSDELRSARLASGLSQRQVGHAMGVQRAHVSAVERRHTRAMTVDQIARQAAVLGLKLVVKLYPVGEPIRDAAQVKYINRLLDRIGKAWMVRLDVPIPLAGDLRAIDIVLTGACVIAIEVVTRLTDIQAVIRAAQLKQRDFGATRLIIVVASSTANRNAIAAARPSLAAAFDLDTQRVLASLATGRDPGRDAIVVLR